VKKPDLAETPLSSTNVYRGRLLDVREDEVRLPNGKITRREYIIHPGAVVIIPLLDSGEVILERQHRYALRRDFIEFPAGKIDPGEDPLECARRELVEETGYEAESWRCLTTIYPCIGYSNERLIFYLAQNLRFAGHQPDDDEFLEVFRLPLEEALARMRKGEICEAKTVAGLFWLEKVVKEGW
jgi:ADP-ribose pyrophosphatase